MTKADELKKGPHKSYTGILLLIFALLILLGSIFFTVAQLRVINSSDYKNSSSAGNSEMISARDYLIWAYVLGYVATGVGLLLAILYFWGGGLYESTEFIHMFVFILLLALVIISGILGFVALSKIENSKVTDRQGANGWIWAAEVVGLVGLVILFISGFWRAVHVNNALSESTKSTSVTVTNGIPLETSSAPSYEAPTTMSSGTTTYEAI